MSFFGVARKDIRLLRSRPRDLLINTAVPLAMAILFGYLYSPKGEPSSKIEIAVIDLDKSTKSQLLVESLGAEDTLQVEPMAEAEARELIEKGKLTAAVVIPERLGEKLNITAMFEDERPELPLLVDPSQSMSFSMLEGILTKVIMQQLGRAFGDRDLGLEQLELALGSVEQFDTGDAQRQKWRSFFQTGIEALKTMPAEETITGAGDANAPGGFELPVDIVRRNVVRKGGRFNAYTHSFAGMLIMFLFFVAIDGGVSVIDERRRGTWRRLRVAPIGRSALLASKVVSTGVQALFVALVMFLVGIFFFGVRVNGSLPGFMALLLLSACTAATFGLMLMGLGRTEGQVRGYAMFAVLLMAFLGGAWFPAWMLPGWLRTVAMGVPTSWMMEGFYAVTWRGLGFSAVALPLAALAGFCVIFAVIGLKTFRWDE